MAETRSRQKNGAQADQPKVTNRVIEAMRAFAWHTNVMGLKRVREEFLKLRKRGAYPAKLGNITLTTDDQAKNRNKCRYSDVMCLDQTRVILRPWPHMKTDFIHANWVTGPMLRNRFICTQGPLDNTIGDFWRMVWQEHVDLIIMLCRTVEAKHPKCAQYWPNTVGGSASFAGITIMTDEIIKEDADIVSTTLTLTYGSKRRCVYHQQWITWPDWFVPKQLVTPFSLLSMAREQKNPVIVHCSAGIGRTGTLMTLEILAQALLTGREPAVPEIIWAIRAQRAKAVQTEEQYLYIHYLILQRFISKGVIPESLARNFCREYEHFYYARTHDVQVPLPVFVRREITQSSAAIGSGGHVIRTESTASDAIDVRRATTSPLGGTSMKPETSSSDKRRDKRKSKDKDVAGFSPVDFSQSKTRAELDWQYRNAEKDLLRKYREAQKALREAMEKVKREIDQMERAKSPVTSFNSSKQSSLSLSMEQQNIEGQTAAAPAQTGAAASNNTDGRQISEGRQIVAAAQLAGQKCPKFRQVRDAARTEDEYIFMKPEYASRYARDKGGAIRTSSEACIHEDERTFEKASADERSAQASASLSMTKDEDLDHEEYLFAKKN